MGYFSNLYNDRENRMSDDLRNQMYQIISEVYPKKRYTDLIRMSDPQLRGLYGQAKKKLNKPARFMPYVIEELDEYAIPGEDGFSRDGKICR